MIALKLLFIVKTITFLMLSIFVAVNRKCLCFHRRYLLGLAHCRCVDCAVLCKLDCPIYIPIFTYKSST
jgi:hypothetical protein